MSVPAVRLLPYAVAGGAHNMAADEVLLEAALAGVASLRFYGWTEATVSLGYFQPERVRLHDDPAAARLTRSLGARALAVGEHVAFGPNEYEPGTPVGDALIAHELAHVVQQGAAGGPAAIARLVDGRTPGGASNLRPMVVIRSSNRTRRSLMRPSIISSRPKRMTVKKILRKRRKRMVEPGD